MTEWYYSKMGLQQGPVPEIELLAKIRRGEISGANLVWKEGMAEWKPLSEVPGLSSPASQLPPAAPPDVSWDATAPEPPQPNVGGNVPLPQPPAFSGHYVPTHIPSYMTPSIVSLVLWAISMLIICLPIGLPCAIVALVYGTKVDSLRVQGDLFGAESASKTARIWMIVSYCLFGLPVLGGIAMLIFVFSGSL